MDEELQERIKAFKQERIDKPPLEIIAHYRTELRAIQDAMDIIAGRWKMPIIALLCNGEFRYSELEKGLPKITPRMLSKELKDLQQNELVIRKVYDTTPVKVTYQLADYGYTLVPLILELNKWGIAHRQRIMREEKPG